MAKEKAPAFQFYPKEFLTDGNVAGMSLQERGAYITLICLCWQDGTLPADAHRLANMVGTPYRAFIRFWPALELCFRVHATEGGRLVHPRLEREREKQELYRRRQSDKGKASAAARQPNVNHGSTEAQPNRQPNLNSPISDLLSKNKNKTLPPKKPADPQLRTFIEWFQAEYKLRRHGADYLVMWERDTGLVKKMLKATTYDRLQNFARILLSDKCDEPWVVETDRGIQILWSKFNWLSDRYAKWEARQQVATA